MNQVNPHTPYKSVYRPEIDGLRAFAVLSVVLFHAFPNWLKGGFIGVDVFFVISGFLITTHIFENLDKNQFSFTDFFGRRTRRIFPALILVMVSSLVFGWFALSADEYAQLGKHIASGATFVTNFILVNESGYFDNAAETKPMLHLWSLSVEEQFYILWPLVLWLAWKRKFNLLTITIVVALISFYLNLRFVKTHPTETFFWPVGRFWELLSGSILAWLILYKSEIIHKFKLWIDKYLVRLIYSKDIESEYSTASNMISFFGLLLLSYGIIHINENLAYPSFWALVPILGAVLIIASGSSSWFNRKFLMNPLAIWFGLISYPLYLWHWPILSIIHIQKGESLSTFEAILAVFVSVFLAWATYFFIELRVRVGGKLNKKSLTLTILIICTGLTGFLISNNTINNQDNEISFKFNKQTMISNCDNIFPKWNIVNDSKCAFQSKPDKLDTVIIGDSHAEHLFDGLVDELFNKNRAVAVFPSSCQSPLLDISSAFNPTEESIRIMREQGYKFISKALHFAQNSKSVKSIYLAHHPQCDTVIKDIQNENERKLDKIYADGFERTFNMFSNSDKHIYVVLDNPRLPYDPSACSERKINLVKTKCTFEYSDSQSVQKNSYERQARIAAKKYSNVSIINLKDLFCNGEQCSMAPLGKNLYRDVGHLNYEGSKYVAPYLVGYDK